MPNEKAVKIEFSGALPGELAISKAFEYGIAVRLTMDRDLQRRLDSILVTALEDSQKVWRKFWISNGLLEA